MNKVKLKDVSLKKIDKTSSNENKIIRINQLTSLAHYKSIQQYLHAYLQQSNTNPVEHEHWFVLCI